MKFRTKPELMNHRKRNHAEKVNACKYYVKGTCHFEDRCWFKHERDERNSVNPKCDYCGKIFTIKNDLMNHIKKSHTKKCKCVKHLRLEITVIMKMIVGLHMKIKMMTK